MQKNGRRNKDIEENIAELTSADPQPQQPGQPPQGPQPYHAPPSPEQQQAQAAQQAAQQQETAVQFERGPDGAVTGARMNNGGTPANPTDQRQLMNGAPTTDLFSQRG